MRTLHLSSMKPQKYKVKHNIFLYTFYLFNLLLIQHVVTRQSCVLLNHELHKSYYSMPLLDFFLLVEMGYPFGLDTEGHSSS
jgi:hypothetical protein